MHLKKIKQDFFNTTPHWKHVTKCEKDRDGRSKDEMDEKFLIKTVPNCKNIFGSEIDQGLYVHS